MADVERGLPVRSKDDSTDNRVLIKIQDGADPAGANKTVAVSEDLAHVRVHGEDSANAKRQLKLSESGNVALDGEYDAATNTNPSSSALIAHDRTATPDETDQNFRPTGVTNSTVHALDISLHDEDGAAYSASNPLPVAISESEGTEVEDYNTSASVTSSATTNHDYTSGGDFVGKQLVVSASSRWKAELQIETGVGAGTYDTVAVIFGTEANPTVALDLKSITKQISGAIVRVAITNRDNQAQDVYSTLYGVLV